MTPALAVAGETDGARSKHPAPNRRVSAIERRLVSIVGALADRLLILLIELGQTRDTDAEIAQQAVVQAIDPAMNRDRLPLAPRVLDDRGLANVTHLLDHVQLAQSIHALGRIRYGTQYPIMAAM